MKISDSCNNHISSWQTPFDSKPEIIPKIIWQTSRTRYLEEEALGCRDTWLDRNPGWFYRLMADTEMSDFVRTEFGGEIHSTYEAFPIGVMRSDFWRILVLYTHGGLYTDTDTICLQDIDSWILPTDKLLLGAENDVHICNWTLASTAKHPALEAIINVTVERARGGIDVGYEHFVHHHSSGGVVTDGVRSFLNKPGASVLSLVNQNAPDLYRLGTRILAPDGFLNRHVKHLFGSVSWGGEYISWRKEREFVSAQLVQNA